MLFWDGSLGCLQERQEMGVFFDICKHHTVVLYIPTGRVDSQTGEETQAKLMERKERDTNRETIM